MVLHDKLWTIKAKNNKKLKRFADRLGISTVTAKLLQNRGIMDIEDAKVFLDPRLDYLYDPSRLKGIDIAVKRINKAVEANERVWIYGSDYIHGTAGISMLSMYFNSIDFNTNYYIYDRDKAGQDIAYDSIDYVNSMGGSLIISIDCCISRGEVVQYAKSLGIDIIIIDRHGDQGANLNAEAVINPKGKDCNYPYDMLSISGIIFKLIQELMLPELFKKQCFNYLDIVAIEIMAADLPITGENRILVKNGLDLLASENKIQIEELIQTIIPLLTKAHGKVQKPSLIVRLLLSKDYGRFIDIIKVLYGNKAIIKQNLDNNNSYNQGCSDKKIPILEIDVELDIKDIGFNLIHEIERLAPFGPGNPRPLFSYKRAIVESVELIGEGGNHLKLLIHDENRIFDCIGWNRGKENMTLSRGEEIDLAFNLELNIFKGIETIQFNIKDLRRRCSQPYREKSLVSDYYLSFTKTLEEIFSLPKELIGENILDFRNIKHRAKYVIQNIDSSSSNLILINTLEGLIDLSLYLSDINSCSILEAISFNVPKKDNGNIIVVNPILNEFDFESYENIYIYDMPIMKEKMDLLFSSGRKIHVLYCNADTKALTSFLNSVVPNRDDLVEVYKYLKKYLENDEIVYGALIKDIKAMNFAKLKFCLDILSDTKLLNYCEAGEKFHIKLLPPPEKKLNIIASKSYKSIRLLKDRFSNYSKNAFLIEFK